MNSQLIRFTLALVFVLAAFVNSNSAADRTKDSQVIAGRVPDIRQRTFSSGMLFDVTFSNINYVGKVKSVTLCEHKPNSTRLRIAIGDIRLTIHRTSLRSSTHSAACGPLQLQFGVTRDLQMECVVEHNEKGIQLKTSNLVLRRDNLRVGNPRWVQARGFGMTSQHVSSGIRSGLISNLPTVERVLKSQLPGIFRQVKEEIVSLMPGKKSVTVADTEASAKTENNFASSRAK